MNNAFFDKGPALFLLPVGASLGLNRATTSLIFSLDRKSTRLNSSHWWISYAVFCLKKKIQVMKQKFFQMKQPQVTPTATCVAATFATM